MRCKELTLFYLYYNHIYMKRLALLFLSLAAAVGLQAKSAPVNLIPQPKEVTYGTGVFKAAGAPVSFDYTLDKASSDLVRAFADRLSLLSGKPSKVTAKAGKKGFVFTKDGPLPAEGYNLVIDGKAVKVTAADYKGLVNAFATLAQLLPEDFFREAPAPKTDWVLPQITVKDAPRFGYRGFHMDVARHFFSVEEVKKILDVMTLYKMNRFHWHLTDDQGWRIEIKRYPKLTSVGSVRKQTLVGHHKRSSEYDGIPHGGYYTQEQIRDIVAYAQQRGIVIIPEIDLPGHMVAALAAYPELGCTGGPYEVRQKWGIATEVLCAGREMSLRFLEDVLTEVMDLFPSEYIHIGGDECRKQEWEKCPFCQRKIEELGLRSDEHWTKEQYLQGYVTARMQNFLAEHGRKMIGWDEVLEGELKPGATVMSWRGTKGGIKAAKMNFDVIMSPNTYLYLDYYQSQDTDAEPLAIGHYLPVEKTYGYKPLDEIPAEFQSHIIGVQANLWTEYIASPKHLEYMYFPRAMAAAEIGWTPEENKDFDRFKNNLNHHFRILDILGVTYCRAVFGQSGMR